jgi:signal transduction histidine kinase
VHRRTFKAEPWGEELLRLATASADEQRVETRLEVDPATLNLNADPELLAQAVLNLLRNAVRATTEVANPVVVLSIARDRQGQFRVEVRDNGTGIPSDKREDIFLPFYTTHKGGSGVGLSFARQVALAHGGSISAIESAEGGATLQLVI